MDKTDFKLNVFSLSERLFPMVTRMLGNRANAEDAIQEVMMKLWEKRNKLDQHPNIKAYIFLTTRNHCIDILRKNKLDIRDTPIHDGILKPDTNKNNLEWKELNTIINKILIDLPRQQREVLLMRDFDGYEFTEIADATELKVEHIRVLLSRARKKVSIKLETIYNYERG